MKKKIESLNSAFRLKEPIFGGLFMESILRFKNKGPIIEGQGLMKWGRASSFQMFICPKHRDDFGIGWRRKKEKRKKERKKEEREREREREERERERERERRKKERKRGLSSSSS